MKSEFELLIKGGSICFYGDWFGRPYDNFHQITEYAYVEKRFVITDARKVEWEHHLYGTIEVMERTAPYYAILIE